jgi:O-antigen/teichoic acid export membrane protein
MSERVHKSLLNVKIGIIFYILSLGFSFISRKIFLDCLGVDFIGLTGTLGNILEFLNLSELGIGVSICYFLYKPLEENNKEKIKEILSVFGYLYRMIGFIIGGAGILVSLFFPLMFKHTIFEMGIIYFTFFSFLGSSLIGYFINYRQILLTADQKNYVVSAYFQTSDLVKTGLQIFLAYYYKNLYVWVAIEFIFSVASCIILNKKISKEYPWLKTDVANGKQLLKKYPSIIIKTKQVFIHRIKDFILNKSDGILIFVFVSLKMVAYYGNYMIIINKLNYLINIISDGMNAGVGNLVAEGNTKNTMKVFWELTAIRLFIVGCIIFLFLLFFQPFILCWLGKKYVLDNIILYMLLFNLFIMLSRGVIEMYIHSYGLYEDTWAAWAEVITNLAITLLTAPKLGIVGILLGKIVSVTGIAIIWKPYFLFKKGLKIPYGNYLKGILPYYLIFTIFIIALIPIKNYIDLHVNNFINLILYGIIIMIPCSILYIFVLFKCTNGMKYFFARVPLLSKIFLHNSSR